MRDGLVDFRSNANISDAIRDGDLDAIESVVRSHMAAILDALCIDPRSDHNTDRTAERVARMWVREIFAGRFQPKPDVTDFPNAQKLDELYVVGPVSIRSCCAHHFCPIDGKAWCGVIPGDRIIGLSKFNRIADWILARPQIQEEATVQLADEIEAAIKPRGLGVMLRASHACMTWRGVRDGDAMLTTSVLRGILREAPAARSEFLAMVGGQKFACQ